MTDTTGFLKVDDEGDIIDAEVVLNGTIAGSPEEETPKLPAEEHPDYSTCAHENADKGEESVETEAPPVDESILDIPPVEAEVIPVPAKRSSSDSSAVDSAASQTSNPGNPSIKELQEASNAKKRRKRSGQPEKWFARLDQLKQFKKEFGHCRVPQNFPANPQLANWAHNQRKEYKLMIRGRPSPMTEERVRALEAEGFNWAFRANRLTWEDRFSQMQQYKAEFGDCLVPVKYEKNPTLGHWVINQRAQYKQFKLGKATNMNEERAALLEAEGFVWAVEDKKSFEERMVELRQYRAEHGNIMVPLKYSTNPQLGPWIMNQRIQYRLFKEGKPSTMNNNRVALLEAEGMVWELKGDNWEKRLTELKAYKLRHGDCKVPSRYPDNPQLGQWVTNQRRQYKLLMQGKKSFMSQRQVHELESLGFVWSLVDQVPWEERFREMQTYKIKHGDCNVPRNYTANPQLGQWISTQRVQFRLLAEGKRTAMTVERAHMLEHEGFIWGPLLTGRIDGDSLALDELGLPQVATTPVCPNMTAVPSGDGTMSEVPLLVTGNLDVQHPADTGDEDGEDEKMPTHDLPPVLPPPEVHVNEFAFTSV
eukprot:CAMPEP_0196819734 /NCGR_PEP_ID=MMETSP1362-20130617/71927_1 /TAXON_ID=163516 /ORGANISM="Leptocylindrus danicus, Strain CCMP1856" /LENGTH=591 /DNA_ID=CAMNT_0042198315 /DNA_START=74 /DNA_END=1849 /DNA_ORIENTATION=-